MSHEENAAFALRSCVWEQQKPLVAAVNAYRNSVVDSAEFDLVQMLQYSGAMVLAAEQIEAAAKGMVATLRREMANAMLENGCGQVVLPNHKISVSDPVPKLRVENRKLIPDAFMKQPPPEPDMAAIKAAINKGATVPGVGYGNGGAPYISFHARKD